MNVAELIKELEKIQDKSVDVRVLEQGEEDEENLWVVDIICNHNDLVLMVSE